MIRQAKSTDYEAIMANEASLTIDMSRVGEASYKVKTQKNGFLLKEDTSKELFQKQIEGIYLVYETDEGIVGHLRVDDAFENSYKRTLHWMDEDLKQAFENNPFKLLGRVAVLPEHRGKGIAYKLLQEAEKQLLAQNIQYVFLFIVLNPFTNLASILFHEENGYTRVNVTDPFEFAGSKYYQSFMYGKKLR